MSDALFVFSCGKNLSQVKLRKAFVFFKSLETIVVYDGRNHKLSTSTNRHHDHSRCHRLSGMILTDLTGPVEAFSHPTSADG